MFVINKLANNINHKKELILIFLNLPELDVEELDDVSLRLRRFFFALSFIFFERLLERLYSFLLAIYSRVTLVTPKNTLLMQKDLKKLAKNQ